MYAGYFGFQLCFVFVFKVYLFDDTQQKKITLHKKKTKHNVPYIWCNKKKKRNVDERICI